MEDQLRIPEGGPATNEARGETAELLCLIDPEIRALRRKLFGADPAPFNSWGRARGWIDEESARQPATSVARAWRIYQRALRACATVTRLTGREYEIQPPTLAYSHTRPEPRRGRIRKKHVRIAAGSKLARLKQVITVLAEGSGFGETELLAYVLMGEQPFLSPWQVNIRRAELPGGPTRPRIGIELKVQNVRWKELQRFHNDLLRAIRPAHRPMMLTVREAKLMDTIRARGGKPPRSGSGPAWEVMADDAEYPNGQAARVAYGRIQKKEQRARVND